MNGTLTQTLTLPTTLNFRPDSRFSRRPSRFPAKASVRASTATVDREKPGAAMSESLYEVLRVKRNATATEIKTAYRSLAKMYHPDLSDGSDGADFIEIHNAYETLSDPAARAVYDLSIGVGSGNRRMRSDFGFYPTRRWETDQCW